MAKVLNAISLDAPAAPVSAAPAATFAFSGTPSFSGTGGVTRYDFKWEVDDGGGYVTIASSGTGLITADTNPVTNSNSQAQQTITVTCDVAGSYTIRMAGAPATGGSYTVLSATQTVEVTAPVVVTPGVVNLTTATFAPTVSVTDHQLVTPGTLSLAMTAFAPDVVLSDHKVVTPDPAALTLSTFAPTVTGGSGLTVTPGAAALSLTAFAPDVVLTDHKLVTPEPASLVLSGFAPVVSASGGMGMQMEQEEALAAGPPAVVAVVPVSRLAGRGPRYRPWIKRIDPPKQDEEDLLDRIIAALL